MPSLLEAQGIYLGADTNGFDIVPIASQAQAQAGTDNTKAMTALRVAQAISALAPGAVIPSQTGNNGKVLGTNGTTLSWVSGGGGGSYTFNPPLNNSAGTVSLGIGSGLTTSSNNLIVDTSVIETVSALGSWTGSTNVTTLGTVTTGTWQGTAIGTSYLPGTIVYTSGSYSNPSWLTALASSKLTGALPAISGASLTGLLWSQIGSTPTTLSGYGITDPIVLTSGSYANPSWITGLAWSKISSTPTTLSGYGITDPIQLTNGTLAFAGFGSITGQLALANGGTGTASLGGAQYGVVWNNGSAMASTAAASGSGYVLISGFGGGPGWQQYLAIGHGGTGTGSPALVQGSNITITGSWPNNTIAVTNSSMTIAGTSTALGGAITLDTITGLSSNGLIKRTGANALAIATAGTDYLTGNQTITLSGNVTGSGATAITTTIANGVVTEAMQNLTDNTTGNVSITAHGYAPKAPNDATKYLDGTGAYSVPAGGGGSSVTPGFIYGLTLANDSGTPASVLDISAGSAADSTGAVTMTLASSITKSIASTWTSGSGNGGLDTGTVTTGTYHVFLISNGSSVDGLFSTSATAPTMPGGYTFKRRIGSILYASSAIVSFYQSGGHFNLMSPQRDVTSLTLTGTPQAITLSIPTGVVVRVDLSCYTGAGTSQYLYSPSYTISPGAAAFQFAGGGANTFEIQIETNTSAQIEGVSTGGSSSINITTQGWYDDRGHFGNP